MIKSLILSVPHTGTRLLTECLKCGHAHVYIREHPDWTGFGGGILVTPLRDPKETWKSWVKRWNTQQGGVELHLFERCWQHLEAFDQEFPLFYLPVDHPDRDKHLSALSLVLGRSLTIDWQTKPGHIEGSVETEHPEPDWDYIYNLPMIRRFYGEIS